MFTAMLSKKYSHNPETNHLMKKIFLLLLLFLFGFIFSVVAQDRILFFQTNWGNQLSWDAFCKKAKESGFDGIDIWLPNDKENQDALKRALTKYGLKLNLMHGTVKSLPLKESLKQYEERLEELMQWKPVLVNSHTGSDFFSYEDNLKFIEIGNRLSKKYNIPVYHETHRGRFSYSLPETLKYLDKAKELPLTLDMSHWMVVHESLLKTHKEKWETIIRNVHHIHARVGFEQAPQVNDPQAPEWKNALDFHLDIWEQIIRKGLREHNGVFTVTSEFGPPTYMPTAPYTRMPLGDQWKANVFVMNALKKRLGIQ